MPGYRIDPKQDHPPAPVIFDSQDGCRLLRRPELRLLDGVFILWLYENETSASRQIADVRRVIDRAPQIEKIRLLVGIDGIKRLVRRNRLLKLTGDWPHLFATLQEWDEPKRVDQHCNRNNRHCPGYGASQL